MTMPKTADDMGLGACFKVRIGMRGGVAIHVVSRTEPVVMSTSDGRLLSMDMDIIEDTEHGDTIGYIDLAEVSAVTWRMAK